MTTGYTFRPAVRAETSLIIGVAGPSGSGKTVSALKIARGIQGGRDDGIFFIDTEAGRAKHYACEAGTKPGPFSFDFQHLDMEAPFSPEAYQAAIEAAVKAGAKVVVVDSMSHEHEGAGGILEQHEAELQRLAGNDYGKRERMTFAAWIKPKRSHNAFVNFILQQKCHFIFCFRAKDKMKLIKNKQTGKMEPIQLGWTPICSDRFEYEMTTLVMMPPNSRGVPDLSLESTKINAHHLSFFHAGEAINEEIGAQLAAWARGKATPQSASEQRSESRDKSLADQVVDALAAWPEEHREGVLAKASEKIAKGRTYSIPTFSALRAMKTSDGELKWLGYTLGRIGEMRAEAEAADAGNRPELPPDEDAELPLGSAK